MATAEIYQQKIEEAADRAGAVFNAVTACTKALDEIPHKIFKDTDLKSQLDVKIAALEKAIAAVK